MVAFADTSVLSSASTSESAYPRLYDAILSTKYFDDEMETYYYGFRYYSPELGRFISRDPIGEWDGINLYEFCRNDPIGNSDVLGLACCCVSASVSLGPSWIIGPIVPGWENQLPPGARPQDYLHIRRPINYEFETVGDPNDCICWVTEDVREHKIYRNRRLVTDKPPSSRSWYPPGGCESPEADQPGAMVPRPRRYSVTYRLVINLEQTAVCEGSGGEQVSSSLTWIVDGTFVTRPVRRRP